jgi:hypothetical protein
VTASTTYVIAQQYSFACFVLLRFHTHQEDLGALFNNFIVRSPKLRKPDIVCTVVHPSTCLEKLRKLREASIDLLAEIRK